MANVNQPGKHKEPFEPPAGYFNQLEPRIMALIDETPSTPERRLPWYYLSVAASLAVLAVALWFFWPEGSRTQDTQTLLAQVSDEAIIEYLLDTDISAEEILDYSEMDILFEPSSGVIPAMELNEDDIDVLYELYDLNDSVK